MSKPPNVIVRGLRSPGIQSGYLLGRIGSGRGPVQLLRSSQLKSIGVASTGAVQAATSAAGFGFFDGGHLLDHELLGTAVFSRDILFVSPDASDVVTALIASTGTAVFTMVVGVTTVGTITFTSSTTGVVAWTGGAYTLPHGTPIQLFAPTPADATLASVSGIVSGTKQ